MTFDSVILAAITSELRKALIGGRTDKVRQPSFGVCVSCVSSVYVLRRKDSK